MHKVFINVTGIKGGPGALTKRCYGISRATCGTRSLRWVRNSVVAMLTIFLKIFSSVYFSDYSH